MNGMEKYGVAIGLLVVLFVALPVFAQTTITTATELQNMNLDLSGDYVLGNDIDASSIPNFDPIGDDVTQFTGTFDGQGHTIAGLTINRPGEDYVGLFGYTFNTTIQNVHLVDTYITGNDYVGGIVGYHDFGDVINCSNAGNVTGNNRVAGIANGDATNCQNASNVFGSDHVGGIAGTGGATGCSNSGNVTGTNFFTGGIGGFSGYITDCHNTGTVSGPLYTGGIVGVSGGTISNCYNTGSVISGTEGTGGIAGSMSMGLVSNCYNTGAVTGGLFTGGLVGSIATSPGGIDECYSTGSVTGTSSVGGLVGDLSSGNFIDDSYSTGFVTGTGANIGGLVGYYPGSNVFASYWNTETSGQVTSAGGEGKTTAELMQQTNYFFWDFSTVWGMPCDGSSYPYLLVFPPDPLMAPVNVTINQGASQADPTDIALITFDVVFDVPVTDFDNGDLDFTGSTALIADATVTNTGDNMHYTVEVTPSTEGTVIPSIPAGVLDLCSIATNTASTSTDNTVEYMTELPTVPLAAWPLAVLLLAAGVGICQRRKKTH